MRDVLPTLLLIAATTLPLAGTGCSQGLDADGYEFDGYTLVVRLDESEVVAGTAVGYTAHLVDEADEPVEGLVWTIASDIEPGLTFNQEALTPRVAGQHGLVISTEHEDTTWDKAFALRVTPDAPWDLDLRLSDVQIEAGDSLGWEVAIIDAWGNDVEEATADVFVDDPAVTRVGDTVTSTVPGTYLVTAVADGLEDAEAFLVTPGPAAGVALSLSNTDLELLQTASATVDVWDAWGNEVDDPWTVWTDRPAAVAVSHRNVTFLAEGWHTVHVTVDGTTLTDSVGPFLIDSTAPKLTLTAPGRGSWRTSSSTTVSGTVTDEWTTVADLTVNGSPVTPNSTGYFSVSEPLDFGTNVIETVAWDLDGNVSDDTRAVLQGTFRSYGYDVPAGVEVHIQEGSGGFDTLESIGEGLINSYDLDDLIPSPVWQDSYRVNPCDWTPWDCWVTVYSAKLYIDNPSISSTNLNLDPRATHELLVDFTAYNPRLRWRATNLKFLEIGFSNQSGSISASSIRVQAMSALNVQNNQIKVPLPSGSVGAWVYNLQFDWYGNVLWDILEWFGVDDWIEGLVESYMEGAMADAVRTEIPPVVEDALQDLELDYAFPLAGRSYTLSAAPDDIYINSYSLTLGLETSVTVDQWVHPGWAGWGSLWADWSRPVYYSSAKNMNIAFSGDLLNQVLYAAWGGGLLDIQETSGALGLPADDLQMFLPGVSTLTVQARPLLPPVALPASTGTAEFELQVGDLELTLFDGAPANNDVLIKAYVTAFAPLDLSASGDSALRADVGDPEIWFDVVVPENNTQASADTQALLHALVPLILPMLTDAIDEIEIPDIAGFGIYGIGVGNAGAEDGYLLLGGNLYEK